MTSLTRLPYRAVCRALCVSLVSLALLAPLTGCGGGLGRPFGGGSGAAASRKVGSLQISLAWPARTRLIPDAAETIIVEVLDSTGNPVPGFSKALVRPTDISGTPQLASVTISNLEVGQSTTSPKTYMIRAAAYPVRSTTVPADLTTLGVAQAGGMSAAINLSLDNPNNNGQPVRFTMGSTITRIRVLPAVGARMRVGKTRKLFAEATDGNGDVVIVAGSKLQWTTSSAAVATLSATTGTSVVATATGGGNATISVTDTESGVASTIDSATLEVGGVALAANSWSKFHGDLQNTGEVGSWANVSATALGNPGWAFTTGNRILLTSPAIGGFGSSSTNFAVYAGSQDGSVYAIDGKTGVELWRYETGGPIDSSPAVSDGGVVYIGSDDRRVYALDVDPDLTVVNPDDRLVGKSGLLDGPVSSSPTIGPDGGVYIGTDLPGTTFRKLNPYTLTEVWKFTAGDGIVSCAAFSPDRSVVYFGCRDGKIYALNASTGVAIAGWPVNTGTDIFSSAPVIDSAGNVYIANTAGHVLSYQPSGALRWDVDLQVPIFSTLALKSSGGGATALYVATWDASSGKDESGIFALNPATGAQLWRFPDLTKPSPPTVGPFSSSPVIGKNGSIYVGSWDGDVIALNPDGTLQWAIPTGDIVESSPAIASNGALYIGNYSGRILEIK